MSQHWVRDDPCQLDRHGDEDQSSKGSGGATDHYSEVVPRRELERRIGCCEHTSSFASGRCQAGDRRDLPTVTEVLLSRAGQGGTNSSEESFLVGHFRDLYALEVVIQAHIGEQT